MSVSKAVDAGTNLRSHQVLLNLGKTDYMRLDTGVGGFFVFVKNVVSIEDGRRITLNVGNPTAFTYSGLSMSVEYGPKRPPSVRAWEDWSRKLKTMDVSLALQLKPGYWKEVEISLSDPGKGQGLDHVALSVDAAEFFLAN